MNNTFGTRLAQFRKAQNLTQNEIADQLHVSYQAVSKWENDLTSPDIQTLKDLAVIFHITVDELIGNDTPRTEYLPEQKQQQSQRLLQIQIQDNDGSRIHVNLPLMAVKAMLQSGGNINIGGNHSALNSIDFEQIFSMIDARI